MHCGRYSRPLTRREMLTRCANGFGAVALAALLAEEGRGSPDGKKPIRHHPAKANSVIFLYMDGGPSQVDTFDYKPMLEKHTARTRIRSSRSNRRSSTTSAR